ncbi:MAG TPA: rhodanese-like domain-containing protein [Rhodocyclaceae bacterium]|nr:rhodanese-like domain-containing protein [Rhodocyclaceae bacterium]
MNSPSLFAFLQQEFLLVTVVIFSAAGLLFPGLRRAGGGTAASPNEATLLINREHARILDVRSADDFEAGHLPEALSIPLDALGERVREIEKFKEKPLIVYCASGSRAARACSELRKQGFNRLYHLSGGIEAWRQTGLPVKKGGR